MAGWTLAWCCTVLGAAMVYASSRHQAWLSQPAPRWCRRLGWLDLLVAWGLWAQVMRPWPATLVWLMVLMVTWLVCPAVSVLVPKRDGGGRHG